jgi:hypothetical protein
VRRAAKNPGETEPKSVLSERSYSSETGVFNELAPLFRKNGSRENGVRLRAVVVDYRRWRKFPRTTFPLEALLAKERCRRARD